MSEKKSEDQMKEWLGLLDDKERAEVLKVQIAEEAKTERERIEHDSNVRERLHQTEGFHIVRGLWAIVALAAIAASTCVGYNHIEKKAATEQAKIEAEHPKPVAPVPAASASAAPAASAK